MADLGLPLQPRENLDLRPSQQVMALVMSDDKLQQPVMSWGVKPGWSKTLLINAQSETAASKPTFKQAFEHRRCLVPCTGWYEWRSEGGKTKTKYLFSQVDEDPFLMAGIWFPCATGVDQLVTLTTAANEKCRKIHNRMPGIIHKQDVDLWFNGELKDIQPLLVAIDENEILINQQQAPSAQIDLLS